MVSAVRRRHPPGLVMAMYTRRELAWTPPHRLATLTNRQAVQVNRAGKGQKQEEMQSAPDAWVLDTSACNAGPHSRQEAKTEAGRPVCIPVRAVNTRRIG